MTSTVNPNNDTATEDARRNRSDARDQLRQLGARIANQKNPGPPPWAWVNLTAAQSALLDQGLDEFVEHYNRIHASRLDEVIPRCWRKHPALTQELPVQFWAWWTSHIDVRATVPVALEYYSRHLPGFKTRLPKLLGKGATNCRKGQHAGPTDPELTDAITFDLFGAVEDTARGAETRRILHNEDFGTKESLAHQ